MNKKTFTVASVFLCLSLVWLGVNLYWKCGHIKCVSLFDLFIGVLFVAATGGMVYNELKKKKRRHLHEVNRHRIP